MDCTNDGACAMTVSALKRPDLQGEAHSSFKRGEFIYNFRSTLKQAKKQVVFHWELICLDCHDASPNNINKSICIGINRCNIISVRVTTSIKSKASLSPT